jgi:hypothetical protein
LVAHLESAGFSALWLDQRAYADRGQAIIDSLRSLGRDELFPPDPALPVRIFRLRAARHPRTPDFTDPRLAERWLNEPTPPGAPRLRALDGWFALENAGASHWRWATRDAALGVWWDGSATPARMRFRLVAPAGSIVEVRGAGRETHRLRPGPDSQEMALQLVPGLTTVEWRLVGPTFRPGGSDPRELGFMVENLSVSAP